MNGEKSAGVRLQNVVKRYTTFTALHGIDLDIRAGEFMAPGIYKVKP